MCLNLAILAAGFMLCAVGRAAFGQDASAPKPSPATPLMALLERFTAPGVPALGPGESAVKPLSPGKPAPAGLPGKGLAEHPMLYIGEGYNKIFLVNNGKVIV